MTCTLTIKNFLSLKNVKLPLAEKTYLIGQNNSGKSAVGKALQFVNVNAVENSFNNKTNFLIDKDTNLGTYSDIVFNHDDKKSIYFGLDFHSTYKEYFTYYDTEDSIRRLFLTDKDEYENEEDAVKRLDKEAEIQDIWNSDDLGLILLAINEYPHLYKRFLKDKFSDLNFSFKVIFSHHDSARHLMKVEFIDKSTSASISFKPEIINQFGVSNFWEIKLKLFEDQKINSLFKDLPAKLEYVFQYYPVNYLDIAKEIAVILFHFIDVELKENDYWNELLISEKKEIIVSTLVQLLRFYKYFNMVIRNHFSIFRFKSNRKIPKRKYILKNDRLPKIKDFGDLNLFLPQKEAEIIFAGPDYDEFHEVITEPEHMSWSETFSILESLKLAKYCYLKKDLGTAELRVVTMDGIDLNIAEAGNELIHLLPVIFKICNRFWKESKTNYIFIEHPELHFHSSKHKSLPSILHYHDSMLMIETHSERLLRELQLRFSKGEMNKKDFSILHFSKHEGETKVKRLTLNSKAIFKTPLPADFFDTTIPAAKQLTEANMN